MDKSISPVGGVVTVSVVELLLGMVHINLYDVSVDDRIKVLRGIIKEVLKERNNLRMLSLSQRPELMVPEAHCDVLAGVTWDQRVVCLHQPNLFSKLLPVSVEGKIVTHGLYLRSDSQIILAQFQRSSPADGDPKINQPDKIIVCCLEDDELRTICSSVSYWAKMLIQLTELINEQIVRNESVNEHLGFTMDRLGNLRKSLSI